MRRISDQSLSALMGSWKSTPSSALAVGIPTSLLLLTSMCVAFVVVAKNFPWIIILALAAVVLYGMWKTRLAVRKDAEKLKETLRDLEAKTKSLKRARLANTLSVKERGRRTRELEDLKRRVKDAEEMCASLKEERDALKDKFASIKKEKEVISAKFEESQKKCASLSKELENAMFTRWKLLSRIHGDEKARIAAVNKLRKPLANYHIDALDNFPSFQHSPTKRMRSSITMSPTGGSPSKFVPKSPSESYLLDLHPDLEMSDSENDDDLEDTMPSFSLSSRPLSSRRDDMELPSTPQSSVDQSQTPISLRTSPWLKRSASTGLQNLSSLLDENGVT